METGRGTCRRKLPRGMRLLQEPPDRLEHLAAVRVENVVAGAADDHQAHPRMILGKPADVLNGSDLIAVAVDQKGRHPRHTLEDGLDSVVQQAVLERGG